jgi:hypothetical protein
MIGENYYMKPKYPIYIISKGRWESRMTSRTLEKYGLDYKIVVEEQEYPKYAEVIDPKKILILDMKYKDDYDTCGIVEGIKSKGSGPARNFVWDHAVSTGAERHWIMDDNIRGFMRYVNNKRIRVGDGTIFKIMEDFVDRYENVALAGPQYSFFVAEKEKYKPISINTRVFSCLLIKNDIPYRWRAIYNEDVDLSLRVLRDGWCTIQFYAFLQMKAATQSMKGGNTDSIYNIGTFEKSKMLVRLHPEYVSLTKRYNRWHHKVNYKALRRNKLIKKPDLKIKSGIDNYGMILKQKI